MATLWTPQALAEAQRYWKQGYSAGQIARLMSISRNAVVGKIHRNRDLFPRRPLQQAHVRPVQQRARPAPVAKPAVPAVPALPPRKASEIIVVPMPFERALVEGRCLFFAADPYSPGGPMMPVCGCPRAENLKRKPYCAAHVAAETERGAA